MNINDLNVGDDVFLISKTASYPRKKYLFVDENGIEWFRHDDAFSYNIKKMTVAGFTDTVVTGIVNDDNIIPRQYFFYDENGKMLDYEYDDTDFLFEQNAFLSEEEAIEFINQSKEKDKQ